MSARGFRSVFMVASCAGAALGCYLVSLRVASERAALEKVEAQIVMAGRDIRLLQTEIGTRGRLAQLERWNVRVLALSAPTADQFVDGGFALARLVSPAPKNVIEAPVVLASAPAPQPQSAPLEEGEQAAVGAGATTAAGLMREASLKVGRREHRPAASVSPPTDKSDTARREPRQVAGSSSEPKKAGDHKPKASAKPMTKPVRTAKVDPLAPLPPGAGKPATSKETGPAR
jgi:hypothetical protein